MTWKLVEFTEVMTLMFSTYWLRNKDDPFSIHLELQIITAITLVWSLVDVYVVNVGINLLHGIRDCLVLIVSDLLPILLSYKNEELIFPSSEMIADFDQSLMHKRGIAAFRSFLHESSQNLPLYSHFSLTDFQLAENFLSFLLISSEISLPKSLPKAKKLLKKSIFMCLFPPEIKFPAENYLKIAISREDLLQATHQLRLICRKQLKLIFDTCYLRSQLFHKFEIETHQFHRWRNWYRTV